MDVSSNQKASFPQSLPGSVMEAQNEPTTTLTSAAQGYELYRKDQFNPPPARQDESRGAVQQLRTMATAAIDGVLNFLNEKTSMWGFPTKTPASTPSPSPVGGSPTPDVKPTVQPAPQPPAPTSAPSLVPSWAKIFEHTGNSEWRPGTPNQGSAIDLRKELAGRIQKLEILSPDGTQVIATGTFDRLGRDGRPRYKFNKGGSQLPAGAIIMATLKPNAQGGHGGIRYIEIPNTKNVFKF